MKNQVKSSVNKIRLALFYFFYRPINNYISGHRKQSIKKLLIAKIEEFKNDPLLATPEEKALEEIGEKIYNHFPNLFTIKNSSEFQDLKKNITGQIEEATNKYFEARIKKQTELNCLESILKELKK